MKRPILFFTLLLLGNISLSAQIIFQENFENAGFPDGWTIQTDASDDGWKIGGAASLSSQAYTIPSNGSSRIAATNDDACNCDKGNDYLVMPALDLTEFTAVTLSFDAYYLDNVYEGAQEQATIEVSLDAMNWEVLEELHGHDSWDTHHINLSQYAGESTVYIAFHYDDGGGWLYGFAIDNVSVAVPPSVEVELVAMTSKIFGEVDTAFPLKGVVYNAGITPINTLEISYSVDGGSGVVETITDLDILPFSFYNFELTAPWIPNMAGVFTIETTIVSVNGGADQDQTNNSGTFNSEIFEKIIVPNKIEDFLAFIPVVTEVEGASSSLNKPTDLDFFPILGKNELWVINQRSEGSGGSTLTISDATDETPSDFASKVDGNAWHFMSLPTGIAFSSDNFNFGTSPGIKDANHGGGSFTGPTLWSSDPAIYAQPSGGNGSHLDMLHGSPFSMGIAHERDNVFWVYDDWNKDIVRYDFMSDHGPGNADHDDGVVRRFRNLGINADGDIPNHLILDKETGWLYFVDNGNNRVMRLDINTGTAQSIPLINETLAEHSEMLDFTSEVIISEGLNQPCGIEIFENQLLVGEYATGDIIVYDMTTGNFEELGRIATGEPGLTGIKIGPDGNIWCTNRLQNKLNVVSPGNVSATTGINVSAKIGVAPNPTTGIINISLPNIDYKDVWIKLRTMTGKQILSQKSTDAYPQLDLSHLPNGVYLLDITGNGFVGTKKVVLGGRR